MIQYDIIQLSWSKRRPVDKVKDVKSVTLNNYKDTHNHFCEMVVEYEDTTILLNARVIYNDIQDTWVVYGLNSHGDICAIRLKKEKSL